MRTPDHATPVTFLGDPKSAEFECPLEPLPDRISILLWLLDGSERRHKLARRWLGHAQDCAYAEGRNTEPATSQACGRVSNEKPISAKDENNEKPNRPTKAR
jgi:hypothetical protein